MIRSIGMIRTYFCRWICETCGSEQAYELEGEASVDTEPMRRTRDADARRHERSCAGHKIRICGLDFVEELRVLPCPDPSPLVCEVCGKPCELTGSYEDPLGHFHTRCRL